MKRKAITFLQIVGLLRRNPAPLTAAAPVHSTEYRLSVEAFEPLKEGFMCFCDDLGHRELIQKVVLHSELKEYLGAQGDWLPEVFHPGQDNEKEVMVPYFLWVDDNRADLDGYLECIINNREGRTVSRPMVNLPFLSVNLNSPLQKAS
jgi:hypothetical protein